MIIQPDFTPVEEFLAMPIDAMAIRVLVYYGWILVAIGFLIAAAQLWLFYIRQKFISKVTYSLLAIDIPRGNEQSPKAVENMFSYMSGMTSSPDFLGVWWDGWVPISLSLEIVSLEGYIQFLIRTPSKWKDLVESAVYSQYPDAEISEVEDYVGGVPQKYPNEEMNVWGWEWYLANGDFYPLKTYEEFEHQGDQMDAMFKDPIGDLMNLMSTLGKDEQMWYQIVITSFISPDMVTKAEKEIDKIIAKSTTAVGDSGMTMMNIGPQDKKKIEAIQEKMEKAGWRCRIRSLYFAPHDVYKIHGPKVINGFAGTLRHFGRLDINYLKPDFKYTVTAPAYFAAKKFLHKRQNLMVRNYGLRTDAIGNLSSWLTVSELATLWHFPVESSVKVPTIRKAEAKKVEAPAILPVESEEAAQEVDESFFKDDVSSGGEKEENIFKEDIDKEKNFNSVDAPTKKAEASIGLPEMEYDPRSDEFDLEEAGEEEDTPPGNLPIG